MRSIKSIRNQILKMRNRKHPLTWVVICDRLEILTTDGDFDTGLAHDIAYKSVNFHDQVIDYYPSPEVAERLNIRPICLECRRPLKSVTKPHEHRHEEVPEYMKWWARLDKEHRRTQIAVLYIHWKNNNH